MLIGLGPFRFAVPTFSVEQIERQSQGRLADVEVVGRKPSTHKLGAGLRTFTLNSTFHPLHLNRAGGVMLDAVHLACDQQLSLMMISIAGRVFGRYTIESVGDSSTMFAPGGKAQIVTTTITIREDASGDFGVGAIRIGLF